MYASIVSIIFYVTVLISILNDEIFTVLCMSIRRKYIFV